MNRNSFRVLKNVLHHTRADIVLKWYLIFVLADAAVIWLFEPTIKTYRAALWYCYAVISTAGFGDIVVSTMIPRIASILLTVYSLFVIAIVTGVVVSYYNQIIEIKDKQTIAAFLDRIERLPELSEEELKEISGQVIQFRRNIKG